eukprot:10552083-Alexandrium_andersonii.AAC.1
MCIRDSVVGLTAKHPAPAWAVARRYLAWSSNRANTRYSEHSSVRYTVLGPPASPQGSWATPGAPAKPH